jgi:chromatin remodeling complex protein RSC6
MLDTYTAPLPSVRPHSYSIFCTPTGLSDKLTVFLGIENGTQMSRVNVTREINKYIMSNNLQDKENKININPDAKLATLFGLNDGDKLTFFNIQKYIGNHCIYPSF